MNAFILQGRGSAPAELDQELELSLKCLWSDLLRGFSHLGLQYQVPGTSERRYWSACEWLGKAAEKKIHFHSGSVQIALEGRINNYCLGHRLFPLFFILIFFHLCFQKIHCFFSLLEKEAPFDL